MEYIIHVCMEYSIFMLGEKKYLYVSSHTYIYIHMYDSENICACLFKQHTLKSISKTEWQKYFGIWHVCELKEGVDILSKSK